MERQIHTKIKAFIEKYELISPQDELVLGVSGGADSMMLLHYFYLYQEAYEVTLKVAHINHGLREAAYLDAELVEAVCKQYQVPFYKHECAIDEIAQARKLSEEEAGREERYNFFISLLNPSGKIVTAHHMNDQAETMLMRFARGADIRGLSGILPKRDQIIRPLLCLTRAEIEAYCRRYNVSYRTDETNLEPIYDRNKVRLECIPYLEKHFNPSIISVLGNHSALYQEEEDFLASHTEMLIADCVEYSDEKVLLKTNKLLQVHRYMQRRIILKVIENLVSRKNITSKHIEMVMELLEMQVGKEVHLPYGLIIRRDYEGILFKKEQAKQTYFVTLQEGRQWIEGANIDIEVHRMSKERINQNNENIYTKYIDYGKIKSGLQIRTRQEADFIRLRSGSKKLKKLFIDDKISKEIRDTLPLIADGDEIVWVVGNRLSTNYYITDDTKEVLEIRIRHK